MITQSHSWTLSRLRCNQSVIDSLGWYNDGPTFYGEPSVTCQTAGGCAGTGFIPIIERTYCTDFSTAVQISSGSLIKKMVLQRTTNILVGFVGVAWASEIRMSNGFSAVDWRVLTRIDLTQKYPINSSPGRTSSLTVFGGCAFTVYFIFPSDWLFTDYSRHRRSNVSDTDSSCRLGPWWRYSMPMGKYRRHRWWWMRWHLCQYSRCRYLKQASFIITFSWSDPWMFICRDCTITWTAVRRPTDISSNIPTSTYVAAIMVEDFPNTTSTIPMSSVPLQM